MSVSVGEFGTSLELWWGHGEAGVDLGVDALALGFEVEGGGGGVFGCGVGHGAHAAAGGGWGEGLGAFCADVGEFDEGGEGGAQGFGVFAGPLDGFLYCLLAGVSVGWGVGS
jgi:hypothetical protein